ncbi:hypothetical protein DPR02_25940 [Burkholderia cepacia]|uniref:Uncharacterized protein n=1 Tax=Burkholderia cepacia TaxID=292 RepID=A0AAQ0F9A5_BURCE|nr:hypothetical protein DPR02_25940 [Burkholderia cepacia]
MAAGCSRSCSRPPSRRPAVVAAPCGNPLPSVARSCRAPRNGGPPPHRPREIHDTNDAIVN